MNQIASKMGLNDGSNDVMITMKLALFTEKKFSFYQKGWLARFQWLEFITRLAAKKFLETKLVESHYKAFDMFYGSLDAKLRETLQGICSGFR